jgi:hypothetical protein
MTVKLSDQRATGGENKRVHPRQRTILPGRVLFDQGQNSTECVIRNLSMGGARLQISPAVMVPDHFELLNGKTGQRRNVRQVWRDGDLMGVAFEAPAEAQPTPAPVSQERLRSENAALKLRVQQLSES